MGEGNAKPRKAKRFRLKEARQNHYESGWVGKKRAGGKGRFSSTKTLCTNPYTTTQRPNTSCCAPSRQFCSILLCLSCKDLEAQIAGLVNCPVHSGRSPGGIQGISRVLQSCLQNAVGIEDPRTGHRHSLCRLH